MKIAIFSGAIPGPTFIERLIEGVAVQHHVLLFGVVEKPKSYNSKNISIYKTPVSHWYNLCITLYRLGLLMFRSPKSIGILFKEIKQYQRFYDKWIWFSKFLPIVLYRPDILHMQWARDLEFYWFLKTKFQIKMMVSLRGAHINYTPIVEPRMAIIYRNTFPKIDAFHAVSEAISMEAQKYHANPDSIKVIHSPIPSNFFDSFSLKQKPKGTTLQVVSVGRFHWKKGFKYAFDAIYRLKKLGLDISYTIIGAEVFSEDLLFQINQLELCANISLIAAMGQEDLIEALKSYDVLLLPSVEEGIANVVLEAMAVGLPVVSTNCGGMAEVVSHKKTGWLAPVRDPQAMADAIVDVLHMEEQALQQITLNAHNYVKEHFNAEDSIALFMDLYEKVDHAI